MRPPSLGTIRTILRERREELASRYGIATMGVFGSCVRGEQDASSDVDILVEFDRPIGLLRFLEIEEALGRLLDARVELVTRRALKPHIGRRILEEVVMV